MRLNIFGANPFPPTEFVRPVELRKRQVNGCADRNWQRLSDSPGMPCAVCGHAHPPASMGAPFCPWCAVNVLRDSP